MSPQPIGSVWPEIQAHLQDQHFVHPYKNWRNLYHLPECKCSKGRIKYLTTEESGRSIFYLFLIKNYLNMLT
jgi:hypothetical protein